MQTPKENTMTQIPNTPFRFFWYVSKPFKWWVFAAVTAVIIASVLSQSTAYFFKLIIDAVEMGDKEAALRYVLLYPAVMLLVQLLYRISGVSGGKWVAKTKKYGYDLLLSHTLKHSHSYFTDRFSGSLMSKINNVNGAIEQLIPDLLWSIINSIVYLLVTILFMLAVDIKAALIFSVLIIILVIFNQTLAARKAAYAKAAAESSSTIRGRIVDILTNVQAVRQYVRTKHEEEEVFKLSLDVEKTSSNSWLYTEKMLFWNGLILFAFSSVMFWSLVSSWQSDMISTGELVFILALYSQIIGVLLFIGRAFNSAGRTIGEMREGLEELLLPYEIADAPEAAELRAEQADIKWQGVSFTYGGQSVFSDFSLHIPAGQRLGLVGQSGAGKTTFVSLLLRQHELGAGSILIDGQDIAKVTQDSLRRAIAVVPQEPALFHRSIRENILYGNPYATEEEMIEVAKKAQAHEFIMALPEGYDTLVGERGVKLSGGQKQRVAIARAMLKDAPILVLDEAT
ncbi:ABC transporter ATP-binding protein, partial [Candidatus Kaiserbacteria bacterium]|nr:ABC transporter ATP-binding protein [Candidatus Kaiserbacteria bacterium]